MEKTVEKQHNRTAFIRQPARVLLVDLSPPFDADTCEYLHDALVNFFSLVTHLSGPCRTPFFGLFALTSHSENLFTLQHVRGNFPRLHTAFEELKFFLKENSPSTCTPDVIQQALKEAAAQFKRQSQSLRQMSTSSCQLEMIFLTCRTAISVSKHLEKFSKNIELENLKKIQVVNVQSSEEFNRKEDDTRSEDDSSPGTDDDEIMEGGLVDVISLGKDILSFQNFFKTWLLDGGTDQEHLRISLPSAFTQDSEGDYSQDHIEAGLTLKCDLHECLLDPLHLPYQSCFTVCSESSNLTGKGVAITKPNVLSYPVYNLTAVKLVNTESVCESVLFGMPYIVRPTLCWKLDWEELESNQQHFYALCSVLKERGVSLLAKSVGQSVVSRGRQQQSMSVSPQGHFLLIPSDNSLLLKSIAVSEMMLPRDAQTTVEGPSDSALSVVASCLDQIEFSNTYNPLLVHSDLYKCLISQSLKSTSASKPLKRRGFQAPQKSQTAKQATNSGQADTTSANRQTKRVTPRAQVRRVVFTAPKESTSQIPQTNEFRSAGTMLSVSKRFRSNSAANLYNSSPPAFPDNLEL